MFITPYISTSIFTLSTEMRWLIINLPNPLHSLNQYLWILIQILIIACLWHKYLGYDTPAHTHIEQYEHTRVGKEWEEISGYMLTTFVMYC